MQQEPIELLEEILDSLVKLDLLVFFHNNPGAVDDARGLSIWVGRDMSRVRQAAEELVQANILQKSGGENPVYSYTSDPTITGMVKQFIQSKVQPKEERARLMDKIARKEVTKR